MTVDGSGASDVRRPSVAGSFYPADPRALRSLIAGLLADAELPTVPVPGTIAGILVPHAGLVYSGRVAGAAWRLLAQALTPVSGPASEPPVVVLLGTNHVAGWLDGIGAWASGAWRTPLGDVPVDAALAAEILALGAPFVPDLDAHRGEHSIEVQLPLLQATVPAARIVPLAVATGTGPDAVAAGTALGRLLARRAPGRPAVVLAISTDMAHYPPRAACERVTASLLPLIAGLEPEGLAAAERDVRRSDGPSMACGMCGIEPAVVGLAALRAMGVRRGVAVAAATSADAGGPGERTVGYLSVAFPA